MYIYTVILTFQGYPRSKVIVSNERRYACYCLRLIVTICLTRYVLKVLALFYFKLEIVRQGYAACDFIKM